MRTESISHPGVRSHRSFARSEEEQKRRPSIGALPPWTKGERVRLLPFCYHYGMSKQIAVRLPDELVDFVDEIVGSGAERSRAAVVTRALERERRRDLAERDARILARTGPDPELAGLAEYAAGLPRDLA
jgi:Arc/MetJ-type ribon-helix-helix transcriptional regulator